MTTLTEQARAQLAAQAQAMLARAYAPYSRFPVGAALRTASGEVFVGVNVENAAYPAGVCAERTAVFSAVAAGQREFVAIAVASPGAGSPCGICRQVLAEFGVDTEVIIADAEGVIRQVLTVAELLPDSFGPQELQKGQASRPPATGS